MAGRIGQWRNTTQTEIEIRNPFYDVEILDFICNLPLKYRKGKKLFKSTVTSIYPLFLKLQIEFILILKLRRSLLICQEKNC